MSKKYPGSNRGGVSEIDLQIDEGEFVAIIGESGSGKSTLLKLIYGTLAPDSGAIFFREKRVLGPHEKLIPGHEKMKLVAQDFNLNTYASVYDNIASMLSNDDLASKKEKTLEMMEFLKIEHLSHKRTVDLSGGEQQRVAIARAIINQPQVLLLDEPFSQIDTIIKHDLRDDLKRLSKYLGITIVLVSHDPMDGLSLADKIVILQGGALIQSGIPQEVAQQPKTGYVAALLGDANVVNPALAKEFGIEVSEGDALIVYPHNFTIGNRGVSGIVKKVLFKLYYDELVIHVGGVDITAHAPALTIEEGDEVLLTIKEYSIVEA